MQKIIHEKLSVSYEYPVVFARDVFSLENIILRDVLAPHTEHHPKPLLLIFIDECVSTAHPGLTEQTVRYLQHHLPRLCVIMSPVVIPGGEAIKSDRAQFMHMLQMMTDARLDRHSYVMAIGGGAVLDAVGFAASLIHRGVRMIRLPTTVLAQNDAGVGVKTAINDPSGKNVFGTFAPPFAVINDLDFLNSLSDEDWRCGIAEAFKVALIKDRDFFAWLCGASGSLAARDQSAMEQLVVRCAELHLAHIRTSGDPFEMGEARPLDFGHWSAHQLEASSHFQVKHGHAVAVGIMLDAIYAELSGWLAKNETDALLHGLQLSGLPLWHDYLEEKDGFGKYKILDGIERFREHLGGRLCITMPVGVGSSREISTMDTQRVLDAISELKERSSAIQSCRP